MKKKQSPTTFIIRGEIHGLIKKRSWMMLLRNIRRLVMAFLFCATAPCVFPENPDLTRACDAVQDGAGKVWALICETPNRIFVTDGQGWTGVDFPLQKGNVFPSRFDRRTDGTVLCLWDSESKEEHFLTEHTQTGAKLLATFSGALSWARMLVDSKENVWLTGKGRDIFRVSPSGTVERVYSIQNDQYLEHTRPKNESLYSYNPVCALEDARGRIWFWSDTAAGAMNEASLSGVLIYEEGKFKHHTDFCDKPRSYISTIQNKDALHVWAAFLNDGLYEVDLDKLHAERVAEWQRGDFGWVQGIFHVGDDDYVVARKLWRLTADMPEAVIEKPDGRDASEYQHQRPWIKTERGLLMGTFGNGLWLIPQDASPAVQLDWRSGFPFTDAHRLFQFPDGRFFALALGQGVYVGDLKSARKEEPGAKVEILKPYRGFVQDQRGHVWGILNSNDRLLNEWDGEKWKPIPKSSALLHSSNNTLAIDQRQRIWLLQQEQQVGIYDPAKNQTETFATEALAFQAQVSEGRDFHLYGGHLFNQPSISRDGRIAYRTTWTKFHYFDGKTWRNWETRDIKGNTNNSMDTIPWFDSSGRLCIRMHGEVWEFTDTEEWQKTSKEHDEAPPEPFANRPPAVETPPGCITQKPDSIIMDRQNTCWLTWQRRLYKAIPDVCVPVFGEDEVNPFLDGRWLTEALNDSRGNAFLRTRNKSSGDEFVFIPAQSPPDTALGLKRTSEDSVALTASSTAHGKGWFVWKIDNGEWSRATTNSQMTLQSLPNGVHVVQTAAIDGKLQRDTTPAKIEFETKVDPARQIASLLAELGEKDSVTREAAVAALVSRGSDALPALKAARENASDNQRWWIDAAMQEIERAENAAAKKQPSAKAATSP
jgi:hypothetical protein